MKIWFLCLLAILVIPTHVSGIYRESSSFVTFDGTEYYYTAETSYSTYYIGEIIDIDTELVVDYFGFDSYSFFDVELWVRGEDSTGFAYFEDSYFTGLNIIYDDDGVLVEWDFEVTNDFPGSLDILVAADFYEDTAFGDEFYEDEWVYIMTLSIRDGQRVVDQPGRADFPFLLLSYPFLVVVRKKFRN